MFGCVYMLSSPTHNYNRTTIIHIQTPSITRIRIYMVYVGGVLRQNNAENLVLVNQSTEDQSRLTIYMR